MSIKGLGMGPGGFLRTLRSGGSFECDRCRADLGLETVIAEGELHGRWWTEEDVQAGRWSSPSGICCVRCRAAYQADQVVDLICPSTLTDLVAEVRGVEDRTLALMAGVEWLSQGLREQLSRAKTLAEVELFVLYCLAAGLEVGVEDFHRHSMEATLRWAARDRTVGLGELTQDQTDALYDDSIEWL